MSESPLAAPENEPATDDASGARRLSLSRKRKAVYALVPLALLFVAVEVSLRLYYGKIDRITGAGEWEAVQGGDGGERYEYGWDRYHPKYGWTNLPGFRSDERVPYQVSINSQGLRGTTDYAPKPPPRFKRIAVFGDSCTFGAEVADDQTVPACLQRHLTDTQVLNFGVHSYGLGQMALRLEEEAFAFHPDHIVVMILIPEDIARDFRPHFTHNKPVFGHRDHQLQIENVPVPIASNQPWLYRHCFTAAWLFGRPKAWPQDLRLDYAMQTAQLILQRMKRSCDEHGVPLTVAVVIVCDTADSIIQHQGYPAAFVQVLQSLYESDVALIDLVDFLVQARAAHGTLLSEPQGHWSAKGNCLIAGQIARSLAEQDAVWESRLVDDWVDVCGLTPEKPATASPTTSD